MKQYILLCIGCLLSLTAIAQEFKFYLNGSNIKDSTFEDFKKGDLLRVVFSNKTTPYNFRIATLLITLTPVTPAGGNETSFVLDNTSLTYTSSPTFTVDLFDRLTMLKQEEYDITVSVKQLLADTPAGNNWIHDTIKFEQVSIRKRMQKTGNASF